MICVKTCKQHFTIHTKKCKHARGHHEACGDVWPSLILAKVRGESSMRRNISRAREMEWGTNVSGSSSSSTRRRPNQVAICDNGWELLTMASQRSPRSRSPIQRRGRERGPNLRRWALAARPPLGRRQCLWCLDFSRQGVDIHAELSSGGDVGTPALDVKGIDWEK